MHFGDASVYIEVAHDLREVLQRESKSYFLHFPICEVVQRSVTLRLVKAVARLPPMPSNKGTLGGADAEGDKTILTYSTLPFPDRVHRELKRVVRRSRR